MRRFADQRPVQQAVVVGVLWPAFSESPANPSQRVCMDYALRRSLSKDAQNRVFHAHWGLSGSDDEAALRRPGVRLACGTVCISGLSKLGPPGVLLQHSRARTCMLFGDLRYLGLTWTVDPT